MKLILILVLCLFSYPIVAQIAHVCCGTIHHQYNFPSHFVTPRNVDIWLPDTYDGKKKYDVLYMHDGQMLFDSSITWNHQSWAVDGVSSELIWANKLRDFIVVGIWNVPTERHQNYFPQKPFEALSDAQKDSITEQLKAAGRITTSFVPNSDAYLHFLVKELKPYIDTTFSVNTAAANTFIAGSSMGGLISLYAMCEYPTIFGGAMCMSTHWPGTFSVENPFPKAFKLYLNTHLPDSKNHRLYFDCGDQTLDALYPAMQKEIDTLCLEKDYTTQMKSMFFPGKNHSEKAWQERLNEPLLFFFGQ